MGYQQPLVSLCILLLCWKCQLTRGFALQQHVTTTTRSSTALGMVKANKQAELLKKLQQAKKQAKVAEGGDTVNVDADSEASKERLTDQEIKDRNDRLRFQQLLETGSSSVLNDYSSDGYLNKQQEEEEINAAISGTDRLFEGDPAPSDPFQELVSIKSENSIGSAGAQRLVPWLRKNGDTRDYLIVVCDPRMKSSELQMAVKDLASTLPAPMLSHLIVVNADTPAENRRWLKKTGIEAGKVDVYSDEKQDWMRAYTALGDKRWSMTMFVLADERVQKLAREVDHFAASRVIRKAVESLSDTRL